MMNTTNEIYKNILNEVLPQALSIGVDYELFWELCPNDLDPFVKAFKLRQEYDDQARWRQGIYMQYAIASCLDKHAKYPNKPFTFNKNETQEQLKKRIMQRVEEINTRLQKEV